MVIPRTTSGELLDNLALARFEKKETRMKPRSTHHRWALAIMGALMAISVAACGSSGSSAVSSAVGTHTAQAAEAKATLDAGKKAQAKACIKGKATSAFHLGMHVVQVINTMVDITLACYDQAAGLHPSPSASASGSATARAPASSSTATTTPTASASASNGSPAAALGRTRWGTAA
jgi:hypothetical protein